jgi:hypothetical protein
MNPYLERPAGWVDFHQTFLVGLRAALTPLIRPSYFAKLEHRISVRDDRDPDDGETVFVADAAVGSEQPGRPAAAGTALLSAPVKVRLPGYVRKKRTPYVAVHDLARNRVVTVIELLSPSNKAAGDDRVMFLAKRKRLLAAGVNYVELDLLRGGQRLPADDLPPCDYYALVSRPASRPRADVWAVRLADRLPNVPIPLRRRTPEPVIDLQAVLDRVYDEAGYADFIYRQPPEPPLAPEQAAWAAGCLPPEAAR